MKRYKVLWIMAALLAFGLCKFARQMRDIKHIYENSDVVAKGRLHEREKREN